MHRSSLCLRAFAVVLLSTSAAWAYTPPHYQPQQAPPAPAPPRAPEAAPKPPEPTGSVAPTPVPEAPSSYPPSPSTNPGTSPDEPGPAPGSLGGPIANSHTPGPTPAPTPLETGPGPNVSPPTEGDGTGTPTTTVNGQPTTAQGPTLFDLGSVKRIQVGTLPVPEPPMRVGNLDVLAPIVSELTQLGATVTRADPKNIPGGVNLPSEDQYFQINVADGPPIVLTMGRSTAWIGSNQVTLRAAPLVIGNQIWLPVVSVTQLLAAAGRLDDDGTLYLTPTIESVELFPVKGTVALTVKASAPIMPGTVKIGNLKDRIYVDFPGFSMGFDSTNSTFERVVAPATGDVLRARAGMPHDLGTTTRVTLDLDLPQQFQTAQLPDPTLFALVLTGPGNPKVPAQTSETTNDQIVNGAQGSTAAFFPSSGNLQGITIVIDPGHGGKDQGAHGSDSLEKNDTLDVALRLRDLLVARHANVLMTRDSDYFVSLDYRTTFANSHHANLFVSIHENASPNPGVTGTETFFFSAQSLNLAREVHKELVVATGCPDRGVSQARFYVIRNTWMPSILTESAFITNPGEQSKLDDPAFRARLAGGIAQGITNYVKDYGRAGLAG